MEQSSEKTSELCSQVDCRSGQDGVKGQDERQRTAPLTPPRPLKENPCQKSLDWSRRCHTRKLRRRFGANVGYRLVRIIDLPMRAVFSHSCAVLVAFAVLAGCHRVQLAVTDHPRSFPGVTSKDVSFYSPALSHNMPYRVYMPKEIAAGTRLPVVYLL